MIMTAKTFTKNISRWLCLCLIVLSAGSCTHDYFVDETNFRIHVPQIENSEISKFYVSFHADNGKHVLTRQIDAPFDRDDFTKQGILRFKLPPGNYRMSCFAEYTPGSITEGKPITESFKTQLCADETQGVYWSSETCPRSLFADITALPMGDPAGKVPVEVDIDDTHCFKGEIVSQFKNLPAAITRVELLYGGLGSKYCFDGVFDCFGAADKLTFAFDPLQHTSGNMVAYHDMIYPSSGVSFGADPSHVDHGAPLELTVRFFQGTYMIGTASFTSADLAALPAHKKPTDGQGNPLTDLILYPQQTMIFTFEGFTLVGIELRPWNGIVPGETTPM